LIFLQFPPYVLDARFVYLVGALPADVIVFGDGCKGHFEFDVLVDDLFGADGRDGFVDGKAPFAVNGCILVGEPLLQGMLVEVVIHFVSHFSP